VRKLLAIALVLALLPGLAGCGGNKPEPAPSRPVAFDPAAYEETLRNYGEDFAKSNEALQPLLEYEGELPDRAVLAYMRYLLPACYAMHDDVETLVAIKTENYPLVLVGVDQFMPSYAYLFRLLEGKASPGILRWAYLMSHENMEDRLKTCESYLTMAKHWYNFEMDYPDLTELLAETRYSFSTHPDFDYPLSEGQSERYIDIFLRRDGALPPLVEEDVQRLWADHEEVCGEFLNDKANRKYPFYDAVQADYQNRYDINS